MKKTLAVLGTVAALATTTVAAPAQARGLGPGLAFGLAAGALAAGAIAASHPLLLWAGLLRLLRTAKLLRPRLRLLWRRAALLSAPLLSLLLIGETKPGVLLRAVS